MLYKVHNVFAKHVTNNNNNKYKIVMLASFFFWLTLIFFPLLQTSTERSDKRRHVSTHRSWIL